MSATGIFVALWVAAAGAAAPDESPAENLSTTRADVQPGSIEDLYYEGAALYSASDYGEAIEKFTRALDLAGRQGTEPSIRAALLFNLARAHTRAYDLDGDARHLRQAVDIHRRFVEEAELVQLDVPDQIAAAEQEIADIEARLEAMKDENDAPRSEGLEAQVPSDAPATSSKRRVRGIALTVSGSVGLGAGVGLTVFATTYRRDALDLVDRVDDPPAQEQAFVDEETRKGRILTGVGAATAALGAGLLIWGIIDLAASKRDRRAMAMPIFGPNRGGLALVGRF